MSLKSVRLKPNYISLVDDVAGSFYVPVMSNCTRFDRISCYFTYDAIASYCKGIYYLGRNGGRYRLLISENISEETFEVIRDGHQGYLLLDNAVKERMRDTLRLEDTVTLSNLAYLMKCGLVEIKFAYCTNGLFHEKSGYVEDSEGNSLCFTGSNNETKQSIHNNYEKFEVTASWLSSEFDRDKIRTARDEFESMWSGSNEFVKVFDPPESFDRYLQTFDRGMLFEDIEDFLKDAFHLDYLNSRVILNLPESIERPESFKFTLAIQSLVDHVDGHSLVMRSNLSNPEVMSLMEKVRRQADKRGMEVHKSSSFMTFLESHTSLEKLALLGLSIKQRDHSHNDYFELFKSEVGRLTENDLRDEQLWDAYFAFRLKRSANFSVPGSGKTATALGMFAYLNRTVGVKRLVVIGPMNCFDSWMMEFSRVFGDNLPLHPVTSTDLRAMGNTIQYHVRFDLGKYNLVLLNYESFDHNPELTDALQQCIDDRTMLVFDEVHRIKAIDGKRASGVIPVSDNSKYTMVMTGTPIPNDYSDVYNFLHILFKDDYDDYFQMTPKDLSVLEGQDALDFNRRLQPFFCRTTKNKLNVPPAERDHTVSVNASDMENDLFRRLHGMRMNPLAIMIRILQIESDPSMLSDSLLSSMELSSFIDDSDSTKGPTEMGSFDIGECMMTSKTRRCVDMVEELTSSGKTVIVWCIFIRSIKTLSRLLEERGVSVCNVHGGTDDRQDIIDDFKAGKYQVMITNPQTLAESISLHHVCHDAVYFEYSHNLVHLLQSKDRIHRLGLPQGQYTQYHYMETFFDDSGEMVSLDREIYERLMHKEDVMREAIENDSLEHFTTTKEEIVDLLWQIGFDKEMME